MAIEQGFFFNNQPLVTRPIFPSNMKINFNKWWKDYAEESSPRITCEDFEFHVKFKLDGDDLMSVFSSRWDTDNKELNLQILSKFIDPAYRLTETILGWKSIDNLDLLLVNLQKSNSETESQNRFHFARLIAYHCFGDTEIDFQYNTRHIDCDLIKSQKTFNLVMVCFDLKSSLTEFEEERARSIEKRRNISKLEGYVYTPRKKEL